MKEADVIVIGAGIIGAACAWQLAKRGQKVTLIDNQRPGATAAGMGHLVCMDDDPAELTLSAWSLNLWRSLTPLLPASCAWRGCGTLWLAETADEMDLARQKQRRMAERNVQSVIQSADEVAGREPMLRRSLAGGLWVPGDGIVYAPAVARWFIQDAGRNLTHLMGQARALEEPYVLLDDGARLKARSILVACGLEANTLLESDYLRAKKGLMAITDRYGALLQHQLVELGYGASAHAQSGTSVAFNIQPRPTGQLLIGSSRQYDNLDPELDHALLARMLSRARQFLPALDKLTIIRCWSGFRAASMDGLPLLGPHPERSGVWLALGHEGLGVTTAPGSARLIADLLLGEPCAIDPAPWQPSRLRLQEATA